MTISVVLDTNFLLLPFQKNIELESEIERLLEEPHDLVVLKQCLDELREMSTKNRKYSPAARIVLSLVKKGKYVVDNNFQGKPDDAMLNYCVAKKGVLCTLDANLRRRAKKKGVRVIFLRGSAHLSL